MLKYAVKSSQSVDLKNANRIEERVQRSTGHSSARTSYAQSVTLARHNGLGKRMGVASAQRSLSEWVVTDVSRTLHGGAGNGAMR